jgi:uncharacterized membrane protein YdjX (TVP38/TMEM64 family)
MMMRKWWILIGYMFLLIIVLIYKDFLLSWIEKGDHANLPIMFLLSTLIASIPIIPFTLFAGLMGAKYGVMMGLVINWFGGVSAAVIYFLLARYFFGDFFKNYIKRYKGVQKFQILIEKNTFISILIGRMVPIIPPPVMNIYSGICKISFWTYFFATALGKVPPMFFIAYSGDQIFSSPHHLFIGIMVYLVFLLSILIIYKVWFIPRSNLN